MKESNQANSAPTTDAGPSGTSLTATRDISSQLSNIPSNVTSGTPKIKPYVRKRPRDSSAETVSERSGNIANSESGGGGNVDTGIGSSLRHYTEVSSETVEIEVKPYVRKRKIISKQDELKTSFM